MKLPVEAIKNLLKLILVGGVAGATGGWTVHFFSNIHIGDTVQQSQSASPGGVEQQVRVGGRGNTPYTGRDFDQSTNKTGTVNNFYGGVGNINSSLTYIDESVTTINNSSTEIYNFANTIREEAQKLSTESPRINSSSSVLIQQEAARITKQATTVNQALLNINKHTETIKREASTQLLAQQLQAALQFPSTENAVKEEPNSLQILAQATASKDSGEVSGFDMFSNGEGSGGQSTAEAAPEPSPVFGTTLAGFLVTGCVLLGRSKKGSLGFPERLSALARK